MSTGSCLRISRDMSLALLAIAEHAVETGRIRLDVRPMALAELQPADASPGVELLAITTRQLSTDPLSPCQNRSCGRHGGS